MERLRAVKLPDEIAKIRKAVQTNSAAFERALTAVKPGMRERDLAGLIDYRMRRLGAECPAFDTIVAAGEHSALPHAQPGAARFQPNQLVLVDMGAKQDGYTSDMSRMFHLGEPPRKVRQLYAAVLEAQLAAIDAVKAGGEWLQRSTKPRERYSEKYGLAEQVRTLYRPRIWDSKFMKIRGSGRKGKTRMEAGMVITIEPGIYLEGWGGIRIEDTVVVTPSGCEILTPTSKELRIVNTTVT